MPRRNSTEFGGEGGPYAPQPYELEAYEVAAIQRRVEPARDDITDDQVREDIERRARKNDTVGL